MKKILLLLFFTVLNPLGLQSQEDVREEVIKGKYKGKIEEKKPESELTYDIFEVVESYGPRGSHIYDEEIKEHSEIAATPLPRLVSEQVRKPWFHRIITPPIAIFHPIYKEAVQNWELVITDATGKVFRTFSNKGRPPGNIEWDGRDREGSMLDIGTDYSYYATAVDQLGNTSKILGGKIRIPGIYWKEELNSIVRLDGRVIFKENSQELTRAGERLLLEASDLVRKDIKKRLRVVVYSRKEDLSLKRARIVGTFLLDRVIMPISMVTTIAGYKSVGEDKTDHIDIIIR